MSISQDQPNVLWPTAVLVLASLMACTEPQLEKTTVDHNRLANVDTEPHNWLSHGRDYGEKRFSPLTNINQQNVSKLGLAWEVDMTSERGLEATPLVIDGVMYVTSTWSRVMALNARTGETLWRYDPQVPRSWARRLCCDIVNRGVAVAGKKVIFGTLDGRLIALNAETGSPDWEVDTLVDRDRWYSITGAPRVVKG